MSSAFGFRYAHENPFSYEFSCGVCSRVSSEEDLDGMIICEGGCKRIFHTECVGLSALPDGEASKWACSRCIQRLRACHICDGVESCVKPSCLLKCRVDHCGKYFHTTCIETRYGGMSEGGVCPLHQCAIPGCTAPITDECYFCTMCLKAYHLKCLPEQVQVICENTCVCLSHQFSIATTVKGSMDIGSRLLGVDLGKEMHAVENPTSMEESQVQRFISRNFSVPFRVPSGVSDELIGLSDEEDFAHYSKTKSAEDRSGLNFVRLRSNEWVSQRPKQRNSNEGEDIFSVCDCVETCGLDSSVECTNRICMVQCDWTNCGPSRRHKKQFSNSNFNCGNRPFGGRGSGGSSNAAKYKIVSAQGKGMGLFVKSPIRAGEYIVEYIGEVMTVDAWVARQKEEERDASFGGSRHFYVMDLDGGNHVVDASRKGNDSRLINHSCDPNLETQKWTVNGESRIGLFALRTITKGEELTFNYQFETFSSKPFKCLCNTAKCTGWIGGKPSSSSCSSISSTSLMTSSSSSKKMSKGTTTLVLPLAMLNALAGADLRISSTRTDGTRKKDEEIALEEISACKEKVDYFLQYIWAGCMSGEEWVEKGRRCTTLFPKANGQVFNPAAILALSVTKLEASYIKERNLLVLRSLNKARRDMARRFYVWPETITAVEKTLEANWISDEICARCRRTGNLLWCKSCVRCFHRFCMRSGDSLKTEDFSSSSSPATFSFTCRRCKQLGPGQVPPIRLPTLALRSAVWKKRRNDYWNSLVLPSLMLPPPPPPSRTQKRSSAKKAKL